MQSAASSGSFQAQAFSAAAYVQRQKELLELERAEEVLQASLATNSQESLSATEAAGVRILFILLQVSEFMFSSAAISRTDRYYSSRLVPFLFSAFHE